MSSFFILHIVIRQFGKVACCSIVGELFCSYFSIAGHLFGRAACRRQHDFVDIRRRQSGIFERRPARLFEARNHVAHECLKLVAHHRMNEVLRTVFVRTDERKDVGHVLARELHTFRAFLETLECHRIAAEIDAMRLLEGMSEGITIILSKSSPQRKASPS